MLLQLKKKASRDFAHYGYLCKTPPDNSVSMCLWKNIWSFYWVFTFTRNGRRDSLCWIRMLSDTTASLRYVMTLFVCIIFSCLACKWNVTQLTNIIISTFSFSCTIHSTHIACAFTRGDLDAWLNATPQLRTDVTVMFSIDPLSPSGYP